MDLIIAKSYSHSDAECFSSPGAHTHSFFVGLTYNIYRHIYMYMYIYLVVHGSSFHRLVLVSRMVIFCSCSFWVLEPVNRVFGSFDVFYVVHFDAHIHMCWCRYNMYNQSLSWHLHTYTQLSLKLWHILLCFHHLWIVGRARTHTRVIIEYGAKNNTSTRENTYFLSFRENLFVLAFMLNESTKWVLFYFSHFTWDEACCSPNVEAAQLPIQNQWRVARTRTSFKTTSIYILLLLFLLPLLFKMYIYSHSHTLCCS